MLFLLFAFCIVVGGGLGLCIFALGFCFIAIYSNRAYILTVAIGGIMGGIVGAIPAFIHYLG